MFFLLLMMAVVLGLLLPCVMYWFYDAVREKSTQRLILIGLVFVVNLMGFLYLVLFLWAVTHISV